LARRSSSQRIDDIDLGKSSEVAVRGPQFAYAVVTAKCGDPRVMNAPADNLPAAISDRKCGQ